MGAQSSMNQLVGAVTGAALAATKLGEKFSEKDKTPGIDAAMAAKARRTAQMKIKAIQANKEISEKAKTRRIGQVIDEYQTTIGGKK